jgi:hypothetical protein
MTGFFVLFGGIVAFLSILVGLDRFARRRDSQARVRATDRSAISGGPT